MIGFNQTPGTELAEIRQSRISPRVMRWSNTLDTFRRRLTDDATPTKIATYLRDADDGDLAAVTEIQEEMEGKDAHLQSVAERRRQAVSSLPWEIRPETRTDDGQGAQKAADYCADELMRLSAWSKAMDHMLTAIGPGVAVAELVWQRGRLRDIVRVPGHRLMQDPFVSPAVRIETDDEPVDGAPTYSPGYLVHCPNDRAGFPIRVTLTRATAWLWLIKHYGVSDWSTFAETYGHPWRIANFTRAAQDGEVDAVEAMLRDMTSDMYGVFTDAVDVKFLEAARNNQPFEGLVDWCERKQSILWLGQTLTTEQGSVGSLALGQVHDNTRASITLADIHAEAAMYREQLLTPMVRFRFPGENLPVPQFVRQVAEDAQVEVQRLRMDQIKLWKELYPDEPLDRDWVAEQLQVRRQSQESPL